MRAHRAPVLIGFDGSVQSAAAIRHAGDLFAPDRVVVVCVFTHRSPRERAQARRIARMGAQLAKDVGLDAQWTAIASSGSVAHSLLALAREVKSPAIVVGSHGRSAAGAAIMGSTSAALAHAGDVPVMVCPMHHAPEAVYEVDDEQACWAQEFVAHG